MGRSLSDSDGKLGVRAQALAEQARQGGYPCEQTNETEDPAERRTWRMRASPDDRADAPPGVVILIEDITDERRLGALASSDPLTGLPNRRMFYERLAGEVQRAQRHDRPLALALIDLDGFKEINDEFGHQVGDEALIDTITQMTETVRSSDLLARIGGDEFALLMPETEAAVARSLAERLHAQIEQAAGERQDRPTVSIGVSHLEDVTTGEELVRAADRSLYGAKAEGRNRVRGHTPDFDLLSLSRERRLATTQAAAAIRALARAVDMKDAATREHSDRVAQVAGHLAEALGWSPQRVERLRQTALVHDVGKIGLPGALLRKPDALTADEYEIVKAHSVLGARIVGEALDEEQVAWVRSQHERYDGMGYPDGLVGDAIPDGAQILAVADAWDAITSDRSYEPERTPAAALEECQRCAGTQLAPRLWQRSAPRRLPASPGCSTTNAQPVMTTRST